MFKANEKPPPTAPLIFIAPLPASRIVSAANVIPVPPSPNVMVWSVVLTVPANVNAVGVSTIKPPANNILSVFSLPIANVPELTNVI